MLVMLTPLGLILFGVLILVPGVSGSNTQVVK